MNGMIEDLLLWNLLKMLLGKIGCRVDVML
jgi:hypothetical protein